MIARQQLETDGNDRCGVMASRYKSKLCRNYVMYGQCPYENRCMFAHGEHELRTMEQNVKDGLITEEAIKSFGRQQRAQSQGQPSTPTEVAVSQGGAAVDATSPARRFVHNPYSLSCSFSLVGAYLVTAAKQPLLCENAQNNNKTSELSAVFSP